MITLVALPTIWLVNRDESAQSSRPNVAAIGLDPGDANDGAGDAVGTTFDPMGGGGAAYLEPLATLQAPAPVDIAVGTTPDEPVGTASASYRRSSVSPNTCIWNGMPSGEDITVVNVANGRSVSCSTSRSGSVDDGVLVMNQASFARIADLTAAPIHVEIRQ